MMGSKKLIENILLLVIICHAVTNIEGGRRGSFGKRISKPSSKGRASVKDTTSEPESSRVTEATDVDMKCNGVDIKMTDEQVIDVRECSAVVGVVSRADLTLDKVPCFAKCMFERKKLVDEKGVTHKEGIANMIYASMTDDVKKSLETALGKCMDENTTKVDPSEESCMSYSGLAMCIHAVYNDICKVSF